MIKTDPMLRHFYQLRQFNPAWLDHEGRIPFGSVMVHAIQQARFDGLDPEFYHFNQIVSIFQTIQNSTQHPDLAIEAASLDILLTNAFFQLGRHLQRGKAASQLKRSNGLLDAMDRHLLNGLNNSLSSGKIFSELERLKSINQDNQALRRALGKYIRIKEKGGWPVIPEGKTLKNGDRDNRIILLKKRLLLTGDLKFNMDAPGAKANLTPIFDAALESAIRHFQWRHGLRQSGLYNRKTQLVLNLPVEQRLLQIRINMDQRRWLPQNLGKRHITVNIPSMELMAVFNSETVLKMRVIVGKPEHQTPVFSDTIPYLVINPYWYIPPAIVEHEILPAMKKNPDYLAIHRIRLFEKMSADQKEVLAEMVDWQSLTPDNIGFYFRQDPGWGNSLGAFKFVVPNRQHIYLHDTPSKNLFQRSSRALSFGCVRLEYPAKLASFVLQDTQNWTKPKINRLMNTGNPRKVVLSEPVPLHVAYWTVVVDQKSRLRFLPDVYNLVPELTAAFTSME